MYRTKNPHIGLLKKKIKKRLGTPKCIGSKMHVSDFKNTLNRERKREREIGHT